MILVAHKVGKNIDHEAFVIFLQAMMMRPSWIKIVHNLQFEVMFSYALGIVIQEPVYDTIAASQLSQKGATEFRLLSESGLKTLAAELCDEPLPSFSIVTRGKHFDELDPEDPETIRYSCADADFALRLYHIFNIYKTIITTVLNAIKTVFTTIWNEIKTVVTTVVTAISTFLTTAWNAIQTTATTIWNAISSFFTNILNGIKNVITTAVNAIKNVVTTAWNNIKNTVTSVAIKMAVTNLWNNVTSAVKNAMSNVFNAVKSGFANVKDHITGLASQAFNWGKDLIMGIVNVIKSCISAVGDAVSSVADKIKSFLHFSVPDEGPLTDYESWMPDFMKGLAKGIENSKGMVTKAMDSLSVDMVINPR